MGLYFLPSVAEDRWAERLSIPGNGILAFGVPRMAAEARQREPHARPLFPGNFHSAMGGTARSAAAVCLAVQRPGISRIPIHTGLVSDAQAAKAMGGDCAGFRCRSRAAGGPRRLET